MLLDVFSLKKRMAMGSIAHAAFAVGNTLAICDLPECLLVNEAHQKLQLFIGTRDCDRLA
jgi:hypothetical protein